MTAPAGIIKKTKNNSKKSFRAREKWMEGKKLGRPHQQFNEATNTWSKIMVPKKVGE